MPPCADEVIMGIGLPDGERGFVCPGVGTPAADAPRRARGIYGV